MARFDDLAATVRRSLRWLEATRDWSIRTGPMGLLARLPELEAAPEPLELRLEERDIDPGELLLCIGNLLDVLARLAEQLLLEADQVRVDGAPMPDVVRVVVVPVLALVQPGEIDDPFHEVERFHRRPS